jgi:hypothetical protein
MAALLSYVKVEVVRTKGGDQEWGGRYTSRTGYELDRQGLRLPMVDIAKSDLSDASMFVKVPNLGGCLGTQRRGFGRSHGRCGV